MFQSRAAIFWGSNQHPISMISDNPSFERCALWAIKAALHKPDGTWGRAPPSRFVESPRNLPAFIDVNYEVCQRIVMSVLSVTTLWQSGKEHGHLNVDFITQKDIRYLDMHPTQ